MKLTAFVKLQPTPGQAAEMVETLRLFSLVASRAAELGFKRKAFGRAGLHRVAYHQLRAEFGVTSILADTAVKQAAAVFQRDRTACPTFRPNGSMPCSRGSLRFLPDGTVSLRLRDGRVKVPYVCGERQRALLNTATRAAQLLQRDGQFYLYVSCNVTESPPLVVADYLGVDLGVVNLATTSDGQRFTGATVEAVRQRHEERRRRLNREASRQRRKGKRPKNVRRALKRLGRRESLFRRDVNHCITKQVVGLAEGTKRGIAIENLKGIRARTRFAKPQRAKMGGWAFAQWQVFCAYKAQRSGVPVVIVNAAYTSQTCFACGNVDKKNRPDQATFVCTACGHTANADVNAAQNIGARAHVDAPMVAERPQEIAA